MASADCPVSSVALFGTSWVGVRMTLCCHNRFRRRAARILCKGRGHLRTVLMLMAPPAAAAATLDAILVSAVPVRKAVVVLS